VKRSIKLFRRGIISKRSNPISAKYSIVLTITSYFISALSFSSVMGQSHSTDILGINFPDSNSVNYSLRNNTSVWQFGLSHEGNYASGLFSIKEIFETTRLEFGNSEARWKDNQKFRVRYELPLTANSKISTEVFSSIFKDRHTGLFNDTETNYFQLGIIDESFPFINLKVTGGPIWDSRREQNDSGFKFTSSFSRRKQNLEGWNSEIDAGIIGERFQERKNQSQIALIRFSRNFYEATSDSFYIDLREKRQDYFINKAGEIETRTESLSGIGNSLRYRLSEGITFRWATYFRLAETVFESPQREKGDVKRRRRNESAENQFSVSFGKNKINGRINAGFRSNLQKYSVSSSLSDVNLPLLSPDNESGSLILSSFLNFNPTNNDSLAFLASSNRLRYDTPDSNNFDDRDELRLLFDAGYAHRFGEDFQIKFKAVMNFDHIVYLFGERSADNHWNRIFLLSSEMTIKLTPRIRTKQSFIVLANYFDYDYDDRILPIRSLVLRNFIHKQFTLVELKRNLSFRISSRIELEEDGKLDWDNFLEQRVAERRITSVEAELLYRPVKKMLISGGISRSSRTEKRFRSFLSTGDRVGNLVGVGPVFRASYRVAKNKNFSIKGKIQRVKNISGNVYYTKSVRVIGSLLL